MKIQLIVFCLLEFGIQLGPNVDTPGTTRHSDTISSRLESLIKEIQSSSLFRKKRGNEAKAEHKKAKISSLSNPIKKQSKEQPLLRAILKDSLHHAVVVNHLRKQYRQQHPQMKAPSKRLLHKLADVSGKLFRNLNTPSSLKRPRA